MARMRLICSAVVLAAFAGCASFDGRGLVAGKSTGTEVEKLMGAPAERLAHADGSSTWYFPRGPVGRQTFAVVVGADGVMRGIEQTLTPENVQKLVRGRTTAKQVREILGPPNLIARAPRQPFDVWEYRTRLVEEKRVLWVEVADDGLVRGVLEMHDISTDPPGAGNMP